MGQTAEVGLGQEFATAEVGVEVEGVIKGGQAENERGPQIRRICGKLRIRKWGTVAQSIFKRYHILIECPKSQPCQPWP